MPDTSARLTLPFILPAQAQKHVTHNEALEVLDTLVQLVFEGTGQNTPPSDATEGDTWAIGAAPTDAWDSHAGDIAAFQNGGWLFVTPQEGWRAWDKDTGQNRVYTGGTWSGLAGGGGGTPDLNNVDGLGIGASWDSTNRLVVAAEASLLNNAGAGHQLKVNKAAASDTASLLFQTGFSGRAEMGTSGSDDFAIKVSGDGTSFTTGLTLRADSGIAQVQALSGAPVFLADDTAALVAAPTPAGFVLITVAGSDPRGDISAIAVQDTGSTPGLLSLFAGPLVELQSGVALTGTTSTDGTLGVSAVPGGLWCENRLGAGRSISITFLGGL